jgi:hypothetical protein
VVANGEGRLTTKLVAETCCMENSRLPRWKRKRYRLECVRDDGMTGEEVEEVDVLYISRSGGRCVSRPGQTISPRASLGQGPSIRSASRVTWVMMC